MRLGLKFRGRGLEPLFGLCQFVASRFFFIGQLVDFSIDFSTGSVVVVCQTLGLIQLLLVRHGSITGEIVFFLPQFFVCTFVFA